MAALKDIEHIAALKNIEMLLSEPSYDNSERGGGDGQTDEYVLFELHSC